MSNVQRDVLSLIASFLLMLFLGGCGPSLEGPPPSDQVISPDTMAHILTDIHLIEGAKVGDNMLGDSLRPPHYYRVVYDSYGISVTQFEHSFDYYTNRPGEMNKIYEVVVENLSKLEKSPPRERLVEEDSSKTNE